MAVPGFYAPLRLAYEGALSFLESLDTRAAGARFSHRELRLHLQENLTANGEASETVVADLIAGVEGGLVAIPGGRFFGWVNGGAHPSALAADWLTSTWDQNAALHASAPAATVAEEIAGGWLKTLLGIPERASFAFTTGCQMAHFTCLAAARHALLARAGWDVERRGLIGAPEIRVITSESRHGSVERALRFLGLGTDRIHSVRVNDRGQIDCAALNAALNEESHLPAIVVLQAGDVNTGAFDDFPNAIAIAKDHDTWIHVDGAFGLWTAASPAFRHLVRGAESADSWAVDGHKWLNVPFDCGYAFVADAEAHRAAMTYEAPYSVLNSEVRDPISWTPEWSRRARGFATYAAIRTLGREGIAQMVERCCAHASAIVEGVSLCPGVEVLARPIINQGLVRFLDPNGDSHDRRTAQIVERVNAGGDAFFTQTVWRGMRAMRVSVANWQTSEADVGRTVAAVCSALSVA